MGMISWKAVFKPLLSRQHISKRKIFALQHRAWTVQRWQKVVFSDEKVFRVRSGATVRAWGPMGSDKYDAKYSVPTTSQCEKVMVWAAINGQGKICLRRCPSKTKASDYQDILSGAMAFIQKRFG